LTSLPFELFLLTRRVLLSPDHTRPTRSQEDLFFLNNYKEGHVFIEVVKYTTNEEAHILIQSAIKIAEKELAYLLKNPSLGYENVSPFYAMYRYRDLTYGITRPIIEHDGNKPARAIPEFAFKLLETVLEKGFTKRFLPRYRDMAEDLVEMIMKHGVDKDKKRITELVTKSLKSGDQHYYKLPTILTHVMQYALNKDKKTITTAAITFFDGLLKINMRCSIDQVPWYSAWTGILEGVGKHEGYEDKKILYKLAVKVLEKNLVDNPTDISPLIHNLVKPILEYGDAEDKKRVITLTTTQLAERAKRNDLRSGQPVVEVFRSILEHGKPEEVKAITDFVKEFSEEQLEKNDPDSCMRVRGFLCDIAKLGSPQAKQEFSNIASKYLEKRDLLGIEWDEYDQEIAKLVE